MSDMLHALGGGALKLSLKIRRDEGGGLVAVEAGPAAPSEASIDVLLQRKPSLPTTCTPVSNANTPASSTM